MHGVEDCISIGDGKVDVDDISAFFVKSADSVVEDELGVEACGEDDLEGRASGYHLVNLDPRFRSAALGSTLTTALRSVEILIIIVPDQAVLLLPHSLQAHLKLLYVLRRFV